MNNNDDDPNKPDGHPDEEQLDLDPDTFGRTDSSEGTASDPGFNEEVEYVDWDEPDRDTNTGGSFSLGESPEYFDEEDEEDGYSSAEDEVEEGAATVEHIDYEDLEEDMEDDEPVVMDEEVLEDEDQDPEPEEDEQVVLALPIGMMVVGAVALILLVIGGYGVLKERSELGEQVLQLRAAMATSADLKELVAVSDRADSLEQQNKALQVELSELNDDYRLLSGTIANLQSQLKKQREQQPVPAAKPAPAPAPKTVEALPAATVSAAEGKWFVNFGAYSLRETAINWSRRLKPGAGEVIVAPVNSQGKTIYRVRVIGLMDKEEAGQVSRRLEQEYGLEKLWVGRTQ